MSKITSAIAALGVVAGLGVAALPLSSYAAESAPVTIRAEVKSDIAVSTDGVDLVDFGTLAKGAGEQVQTLAVTVSGSVAKYDLGVMDYDNDNNMVNTAGGSDVIPAQGGVAELTAGWGFRLENRHTTPNNWEEMPLYNAADATKNLVEGGTLNTTDGSVSNVQFGINIDGISTLADGVYEDKVIFTAVENTTTAP